MKIMKNKAKECLKSVFGYTEFRPLQEHCIESVLAKKDTLLIMSTGGGKSLCYQIPALIFKGLTVVVSPLISLMHDQVSQLKEVGVEAELLNSTLSWEEYEMNKLLIRRGQTRILFMAPETLFKEDVLNLLSAVDVDCIAVDEAHCISEWGHDFRPEYRKLAQLRELLPDAVWLAMTATATPRVQEDIHVNLNFNGHQKLVASFNRVNLFYEVIPKMNPLTQTIDFLKRFADQSGIIYCFSRRQVDTLTVELNKRGLKALPYHAGLNDDVRRRNQEQFIRDDAQIIVATIAFGMGINKPNVRFVVHYDLPRNIESYYQETGRAGRDGLPAHCLLLFGYGDTQKVKYLINQKSDEDEKQIAFTHLNAIVNYAETEICRRVPLITYFGEKYSPEKCGLCDNCVNPKVPTFDMTLAAKKMLACVVRTGQRFGAAHVIDVLRGSESQKVLHYAHNDLDVHGIGKEFSLKQWRFLLRQFFQKQLLKKEDEKFGVLKLTPKAVEILNGELQVLGFPPPVETKKSKAVKKLVEEGKAADADTNLFELLRKKRKELADAHNVPPYIIFSDKSLIEMSQYLPQNKESFSGIYGVGAKKLETYGDEFIDLIKDYCVKQDSVGSGQG